MDVMLPTASAVALTFRKGRHCRPSRPRAESVMGRFSVNHTPAVGISPATDLNLGDVNLGGR